MRLVHALPALSLPTSIVLLSLISQALATSPPFPPEELAFRTPWPTLDERKRQVSNLQTFNGTLGGASAPPITYSGDAARQFEVQGDTFDTFAAAAQRTCDTQFNDCADAANASGNQPGLTVQDCESQKTQCLTAQQSAPVQSFTATGTSSQINLGPDPEFPDFDLICDA